MGVVFCWGGGGGVIFYLHFMLFPTFLETNLGNNFFFRKTIVDRDSGNLYPIYIKTSSCRNRDVPRPQFEVGHVAARKQEFMEVKTCGHCNIYMIIYIKMAHRLLGAAHKVVPISENRRRKSKLYMKLGTG